MQIITERSEKLHVFELEIKTISKTNKIKVKEDKKEKKNKSTVNKN